MMIIFFIQQKRNYMNIHLRHYEISYIEHNCQGGFGNISSYRPIRVQIFTW